MATHKPSDRVVAFLVSLSPVILAVFTHDTVKVYRVSGPNAVTCNLEFEVPISAVSSFPPVKLYLTMYLPVLTLEHPLKVNTIDLEVIVLMSIDTCGLGGTVGRCY